MFELWARRALIGSPAPRPAVKRPTRRLHVEQLEPRQLLAGQVVLNPAQPLGVISRDLIGTNVIYTREHDALWSDGRVAGSLKELRTGFMRYPGGEVTSFYHWNKNTGVPYVDSWNSKTPHAVQPGDRWMSFDEYMRQVRLAGAKPLVGVNIQSGHNHGRVAEGVAEAVALVRYAKSRGYGVQHYFIDNEQYASNANMSAAQYANYINLYATAMRKVDPNLKIVANWQNHVEGGVKTILRIAGKNIDFIDFHFYWNWDNASFDEWRGPRAMTHRGQTFAARIQDFRREVARNGLDTKLAVFEWNLGPSANLAERPSPFQAALMNSEMFMQFVWGRLDAAAFWPLHVSPDSAGGEAGRSLLTPEKLQRSPIHQMLSMYKSMLGTQLVPARAAGGVLATAGFNPANDTTTVMLLQKIGQPSNVQVSLGRYLQQPGSYQVQAQTFRAAGGDLSATQGEIVNVPFVLDRASGRIRLSVGGYTLTKLIIKHVPPAKPQPPGQRPATPIATAEPPAAKPNVSPPATTPKANPSIARPPVVVPAPTKQVMPATPSARPLPSRVLARFPIQARDSAVSAGKPAPQLAGSSYRKIPSAAGGTVAPVKVSQIARPLRAVVTSAPVARDNYRLDELFGAFGDDASATPSAELFTAATYAQPATRATPVVPYGAAQDAHLSALLGSIHDDEATLRKRRNWQALSMRSFLADKDA